MIVALTGIGSVRSGKKSIRWSCSLRPMLLRHCQVCLRQMGETLLGQGFAATLCSATLFATLSSQFRFVLCRGSTLRMKFPSLSTTGILSYCVRSSVGLMTEHQCSALAMKVGEDGDTKPGNFDVCTWLRPCWSAYFRASSSPLRDWPMTDDQQLLLFASPSAEKLEFVWPSDA